MTAVRCYLKMSKEFPLSLTNVQHSYFVLVITWTIVSVFASAKHCM